MFWVGFFLAVAVVVVAFALFQDHHNRITELEEKAVAKAENVEKAIKS